MDIPYLTHDSEGMQLPTTGKLEALLIDGAEEIEAPYFHMKDLVCIIHTHTNEIVYYVSSKTDFETIQNEFSLEDEDIEVTWLLYPWAKKLAQ